MAKLWEKFETNFLKYSLAAILLAIPLYPKFPLFSIPGTYVAVRLEDFLLLAIFVFWTFWALRHRKQLNFINKVGLTLAVFFAVALLSTLSAILITHTVIPHIGLLHFLRRVEYIFAFFLAATAIKNEKDLLFFIELAFWVTLAVLAFGLGQRYLEWPVISTQNPEFAKGVSLKLTPGARLSSTFAGHYDLAAYTVLLIPVFISLWVAQVTRWYKFVGLAGFATSLWLLLASSSRISFPAYLLCGLVVFHFTGKKKLILPFLILSLVLMATTSELAARYMRTADVYLAQISQYIKISREEPTEPPYQLEILLIPTIIPGIAGGPAGKLFPSVTPIPSPTRRPKLKRSVTPAPYVPPVIIEERSTEIRLNVEWPRAIRAFRKNPLLGTGFSSITLATDNDYLRLLGEVGILGLAASFLIFASIARVSAVLFKSKSKSLSWYIGVGLTGSVIGLLVNATFIDVFEASKVAIVFWSLCGILVAVANLDKKPR